MTENSPEQNEQDGSKNPAVVGIEVIGGSNVEDRSRDCDGGGLGAHMITSSQSTPNEE